jgi:hypothetical protein
MVFTLLTLSEEREEFKVSKVTPVSVFIQENAERIFETDYGSGGGKGENSTHSTIRFGLLKQFRGRI